MNKISEVIKSFTGVDFITQEKILYSLLLFLIIWLVKRVTNKIVYSKIKDIYSRYIWRKAVGYIYVLLVIVLLANIWFNGFDSIGTYLGLVSAGIAISLKDLIVNMIGWIFLMIRRPFAVGDRIQIGDQRGDVIDVRIFQFSLLEIGNWVDAEQSTGRIMHIPNGKVFTEPLANYSAGFKYIWNELPVLVTFESDWKKAKALLTKIINKDSDQLTKVAEKKIKEASQKFMIFYSNLTPIVYTAVKPSGVLLTIRYLCDPQKRRGTEHSIWEDILQEFAKHSDISFAYPTQRFYQDDASPKE